MNRKQEAAPFQAALTKAALAKAEAERPLIRSPSLPWAMLFLVMIASSFLLGIDRSLDGRWLEAWRVSGAGEALQVLLSDPGPPEDSDYSLRVCVRSLPVRQGHDATTASIADLEWSLERYSSWEADYLFVKKQMADWELDRYEERENRLLVEYLAFLDSNPHFRGVDPEAAAIAFGPWRATRDLTKYRTKIDAGRFRYVYWRLYGVSKDNVVKYAEFSLMLQYWRRGSWRQLEKLADRARKRWIRPVTEWQLDPGDEATYFSDATLQGMASLFYYLSFSSPGSTREPGIRVEAYAEWIVTAKALQTAVDLLGFEEQAQAGLRAATMIVADHYASTGSEMDELSRPIKISDVSRRRNAGREALVTQEFPPNIDENTDLRGVLPVSTAIERIPD